jgi:hypothetical protein
MFRLGNYRGIMVTLCLCLVLTSCVATPYRYRFSLVEPKSEALGFEDAAVQFRFVPTPEHMRVTIRNKGDREIHLVRDNAKFINHLGKSHSVLFGHNFETDTRMHVNNGMYSSPLRIGPGSEITGNVWINVGLDYSLSVDRRSSANVTYLMQPLFPRNKYEGKGEALKDSTFDVVLPIDFDGQISRYLFTFMINDVIE